jgi:hypothetical protein
MSVTKEDSVTTGLTLANTVEVVTQVITKIAGDEIANQLNGEDIYHGILPDTVAVKLQSKLAQRISI